jgi:hypothetical protein
VREAARTTANEQLGTDRVLQTRDRERDRRLRNQQLVGGGRHRALLDGADGTLDLSQIEQRLELTLFLVHRLIQN